MTKLDTLDSLRDKVSNHRGKLGVILLVIVVLCSVFVFVVDDRSTETNGELLVSVESSSGEELKNLQIVVDNLRISEDEYVELSEGSYTVEITADNHKSVTRSVTISSGEQKTISVELTEKVTFTNAPECDSHTYDGEGTEENPYKVSTVYDLQCIESDLDAHYELTSDINASYTSSWNNNRGFDPIGYISWNGYIQTDSSSSAPKFTGSINGNGYSVIGLHSKTTDISHSAGLVSLNNGTIKNIKLVDPDITSSSTYAGGIAGENLSDGLIESSAVERGSITAGDYDGGGITGFNSGTINNVYVINTTIKITDDGTIGGLVGETEDLDPNRGTTTNGYAVVTVTGDVKAGQVFGSSNSNTQNIYYNVNEPAVGFGQKSDEIIGLQPDELQGTSAKENMDLDWKSTWETTDTYPTLQIFKND